jgi:hypothetical protein
LVSGIVSPEVVVVSGVAVSKPVLGSGSFVVVGLAVEPVGSAAADVSTETVVSVTTSVEIPPLDVLPPWEFALPVG